MTVNVLAEAGMSECARTEMECLPGFGLFLTGWAVAGILVLVWIAGALSATVGVVASKLGVMRFVLWMLAVWIVPLVGAIAWYVYERRQRTSTVVA